MLLLIYCKKYLQFLQFQWLAKEIEFFIYGFLLSFLKFNFEMLYFMLMKFISLILFYE